MLILKKILFLVSYCFVTQFSIAQQIIEDGKADKFRAVHWGLDEGLSQGETYCMIKDVKGFLWIGTKSGLNRFDGNSFKIFFHDDHNKRTIANDFAIYGMIEDSLHNIWIGTAAGVSIYNIKSDTFSNISPGSFKIEIVPFYASKNEVYCWEPGNMITAYDIHSFARKKLAQYDDKDLAGNGISRSYIYVDTLSNSVWMLTGTHGVPGGGLVEISLKDGRKQHYEFACFRNIPGHAHGAEAMTYDVKRNSLWLNTGDGLVEFSLADKQFHRVHAFDELIKFKDYNRFVGVTLDKNGRVWLATDPKGILIYDPADESLTKPFPDDSVKQHEVSDANACLYTDKDGITWSGFWLRKGIQQIIPYSQVIKHYTGKAGQLHSLRSNALFTMIPAGNGKIWISTRDGGLNVFDTQTGFISVLTEKDLPGIDFLPFVAPVIIDTINQKAWIATETNFFKTDLVTKKSYPVIYRNMNNEIIPWILGSMPLSRNNRDIAITASYNHQEAIFIVNIDSNIAQQVLSFPDNTHDAFSTNLAGNHLFLKNYDYTNGNFTYVNKNGKWIPAHTPADSIRWTDIIFNEADSSFWLAGERQLLHYDRNFHIIRRYTTENGLPEFSIAGLIFDKKEHLWFYTDRSVNQLNIETGVITQLTEKDGFEKQDFSALSLAAKDINGNIYFAGGVFGTGFNQVKPDNFTSPPSSVYIQAIEVNQKPLTLSASANDVQKISLQYFQNKISIATGIIDFYSKGNSRIRYKLDKMDTTWQYAPYYYTIRYEGLPAGKYTLLMQASNAANEFAGPIKTLFIQINPAFWNTWWFRIVAVISLIALFYGIIRWRLQQKFRLQLERSENERQIVDIKQKATELEMQALRAQMNPHFIFNSLNSINRFILQNNRAQASEYLTKFSKLVRMILQNSQSHLITLESELESLGLYLEMEALRFNYHFDYKISVPKDLEIEVLKVPPLILQPYVENAIWHGLMHKEEKGQLDIEITQEDDHVYFKIIDNGIGRKRATELASKSATKHKSMGLRITAHRIAMMQNSNGLESPVKIIDLVEPDGVAAGTEVLIKMPVIYD